MIPIFLASDETYASFMAVTIESICCNTSEQLQFYILDGGIYEQTKEKINAFQDKFPHINIEYIRPDLSLFKGLPLIKYFSVNAYFRYLIPILKPNIQKALYLDTDMVITGDIAEIYNRDLNQKGLGAIPYLDVLPDFKEEKYYYELYQRLSLNTNHLYFNSGLLLIDCDYWRQNQITEKLIQKTEEMAKNLTMADQDILNILFENAYQILPEQYNVVIDITDTKCDIKKYVNAFNGCVVLHYTGGFGYRPWVKSNVPFGDLFWNYAQNTLFYDVLTFKLIRNELSQISMPPKELNLFLFNCIPLLSVQYKKKKKTIKLFNLIPLLTWKDKK